MSDFDPAEYVTVPEGWSCKRLADCTIDGNISYGIVQPGQHDENGIPVIRVNNVNNGQLDLSDVLKVSPEVEKKYERTRLEGGEVLLTLVGSTGQSFVAPKELAGWNVPRAIAVIRADEEVGADWINICLQSKETMHFLNVRANTTVQKTLNLKDVRDIPILIPPKGVKESIEGMALSLSEKIQLNRQTNQTLEHIAQAIFKSWFVDFEPTRAKAIIKAKGGNELAIELAAQAIICGAMRLDELEQLDSEYSQFEDLIHSKIIEKYPNPQGLDYWQPQQLKTTAALFPSALVDSELSDIPEGWEVAQLGEIIEFNPRRTLKKGELAPYLDMKNVPTKGHLAEDVYLREMASGTKFINGDTLLARITPCLENGKTAYVDFLNDDQVGWGSTEFIVMRPKNGRPLSLGYLIARLDSFRTQAIQTMTGTSGRQRANAKALSEQVWLKYPLELLEVFDAYSSNYLKRARSNGNENKHLAQLRNALLPQLLSGELSVQSRRGV